MNSDKDVTQGLLGQVQRKPVTNDHVVEAAKLDISGDPDAVVSLFCVGCGSYHRLTKIGASSFIEQLGVEQPTDLASHYFEASRCTACDADFTVTALKDIPKQ